MRNSNYTMDEILEANSWHLQTEKRYYTISLHTDLFGYWLVERNWGGRFNRINGRKLQAFEKYKDAKANISKIFAVRKRNGYG